MNDGLCRPATPTVPRLVSTIIPVFNRGELVRQTVDSVLAQTYRPIEIILVNDGSTDDSADILNALAAQHPDIIRVHHQANAGPGPAREAGRQLARGAFIQYLDSDDLLASSKFDHQVRALEDAPECGIAYGITSLIGDDGRLLKAVSKHTGERHERLFPLLLQDRWWHTSSPLYRRAVSDAAGPWPDYRPEDWDLEVRMAATGVRLTYCPVVVSYHRDHDAPGRVSAGRWSAYVRDEAKFLPRLVACAQQAGYGPESPEMTQVSRWAAMRARHLGLLGDPAAADMLRLALAVTLDPPGTVRWTARLARWLGWRATGRLWYWARG